MSHQQARKDLYLNNPVQAEVYRQACQSDRVEFQKFEKKQFVNGQKQFY